MFLSHRRTLPLSEMDAGIARGRSTAKTLTHGCNSTPTGPQLCIECAGIRFMHPSSDIRFSWFKHLSQRTILGFCFSQFPLCSTAVFSSLLTSLLLSIGCCQFDLYNPTCCQGGGSLLGCWTVWLMCSSMSWLQVPGT